jgi:hypothetical protein
MPSLRSAILPCCVNAGSGLLRIPACSSTSTLRPSMTRLSSPGSGYRCITTVGRNIWMPPTRAAGKVPLRSSSWLICTSPPQWSNKHLLPPHIDDKRGEPKMTPCLAALVKRVAELHDTGLSGIPLHRRIYSPTDSSSRS